MRCCKTSIITPEGVYQPRERDRPDLRYLSDDSAKDQPWDEHRAWADTLAETLADAGLTRPAVRVRDCAEALFFRLTEAADTGELMWKLKSAPFCHYRHCSICQWRRSLRLKAIVMSALPEVLRQYPTARFALLTLTVRNCNLDDLRATVRAMNRGFKRLIERKNWPALGWIRALEVTRGKDGSAHPHFHVLLMLPASYFSGQAYVPTREWVKRWREVMRLDYDPVCDVRAIRPKARAIADGLTAGEVQALALRSAVAELVKYATKTADLIAGGPDWLAEYVTQMHGAKATTSGGVLKGILKDVREQDEDDADLVHVDGDEESVGDEATETLAYHWRRKNKRYARKVTVTKA